MRGAEGVGGVADYAEVMSAMSLRMSGPAFLQVRTLAVSARVRSNASVLARYLRAAAPTTVLLDADAHGGALDIDGWQQSMHRMWWAAPASWRDDWTDTSGHAVVSVVRDDAALVYTSGLQQMYTSEPPTPADEWMTIPPPRGIVLLPTVERRIAEFPLLRPPSTTDVWVVTDEGPGEHLGRACRYARAARRPDAPHPRDGEGAAFWVGADAYECLLDDELGIALQLRTMIGGRMAQEYVADEVRVDASITPELFAFRPPSGTRVAHVVWRA